MPSLWKLFQSHMDKNCGVLMADCYNTKDHSMAPTTLFKTYELLNEIQPDRIMCVDRTKVEENRIHASIHMKLTDSRFIYDSAIRHSKEPELIRKMPVDRQICLRHKIGTMSQPQEVLNQYYAWVDADLDLLLYAHVLMDITFDDATRKITHIHFHGDLTSMHAIESTVDIGGL